MMGQVIVDISKLHELDEGLKNTVAQIDVIISENEERISKIKNTIIIELEKWKRKQEEAYVELIAVREELTRAEEMARNSENGEVPSYYYQKVALCQAKYDDVSCICAKIERLYDDFEDSVSIYNNSITLDRQDYVDILKKGSYILNQYADLVQKSVHVTSSGNTANNSFNNSFNTVAVGSANCTEINIDRRNGLPTTAQTWTVASDGSKVFNTPIETGNKLDSCQGKVNGYLGTCGLVSCVNVLRLAGYSASESEVVAYASTTSAGFGRGKLCTTKSFPEENGGTSAKSRQQILEHFGVKSELQEANITNIEEAVSQGRGVIISVYAGMLYYGRTDYRDLHAITVTSVKKDRFGNVLGFYVCDSGTGGVDSSKYYTTFQLENALSGRPMNVTSIIR